MASARSAQLLLAMEVGRGAQAYVGGFVDVLPLDAVSVPAAGIDNAAPLADRSGCLPASDPQAHSGDNVHQPVIADVYPRVIQ